MKLDGDFYERDDVVAIGRELLGKVLCTRQDGRLTTAIICETEAYAGVSDRASHAYGGRRTKRTEPMFGPGGSAYVYLCYGIHHLFNVVTGGRGTPHAVLVRAAVPCKGLQTILERRGRARVDRTLMTGPGTVAQALGITTAMTGLALTGRRIWLEDRGFAVDPAAVLTGPRIGVDYAGSDAALPYRFRVDPGSFDAAQD